MIWYVLFSSLIFVYCTVLARIDFLSKKAILILAIYMILIDSTIIYYIRARKRKAMFYYLWLYTV